MPVSGFHPRVLGIGSIPVAGLGRSRHLQSLQRSGAGAEAVGFEAEALEEGDVEVAEGRRILRVEGEVLTVLEAAAGEMGSEVPLYRAVQVRPPGLGAVAVHAGNRRNPSTTAASRSFLSVATISISPATRAAARCSASIVRMGTDGAWR